jgi:ComF family protein
VTVAGGVRAWRRLLDLLLPPRCGGCRRRGSWLCDACRAELERPAPPLCPRCGDEVTAAGLCRTCRAWPPAFDVAWAAYHHAGPLRRAVHHFKYDGEWALGEPLGELLAEALPPAGRRVDLVAPVPLHPARRRERGYNQSELLARVVARRLDRPLSATLVRQRPTRPQVGLDAAARRQNVVDAFLFNADGPSLEGCRILLIDDVCTSGATLDACARALRAGGPAWIGAATLTRG